MHVALRYLFAVVLLAGCGGSEPEKKPAASDAQQAEAAVLGYLAGFSAADGERACRHVTASAQKNVAIAAKSSTCQEAMQRLGQSLGDAGSKALRSVRVQRITIRGAKATVTLTSAEKTPTDPVSLTKVGGTWKVSDLSYGVNYRSFEEAECISGGMAAWRDRKVAEFWFDESREDFRQFITQTCRRANEQLEPGEEPDTAQFVRIGERVMNEMIDRGQIKGPS